MQNHVKYRKTCKQTALLIFDDVKFIARCSKYYFWIPGQISGRRSKKYFGKKSFFEMKKISEEDRKNIFRDQKKSKKFPMKSQ